MEKKSIGSFLTALRKANGLTQKQLAEKLNVSDKAVSRWERDECAPDLSLIPVLAEIYGVTSDEILRGQRTDPEKLYHGGDHVRALKQKNRILHSTKMKFGCRSLFAVSSAIIGVILAYILNVEFSKGNAGFLTGCIFMVMSILSQIIFLIQGIASINDEEWTDSTVENCKGFILLSSEWCLGVIMAAFALCVPLAGQKHIEFSRCLEIAIPWIFGATVLVALFSFILNRRIKVNGSIDFSQITNHLRLRSSSILVLIFVVLLGLQTGINSFLVSHKHLYAPHDTIDSISEFGKLMADPKTEDGYPMYIDTDTSELDTMVFWVTDYENHAVLVGNPFDYEVAYTLQKSQITKKLNPDAPDPPKGMSGGFKKEYGYPFEHLNRTISHYEISDHEDIVPIYTFTAEQNFEANERFVIINLVYLLTYGIAACLVLMNKKKKSF